MALGRHGLAVALDAGKAVQCSIGVVSESVQLTGDVDPGIAVEGVVDPTSVGEPGQVVPPVVIEVSRHQPA